MVGLELQISHANGRSRLACFGELDVGTASRFRAAVDEMLASSPTELWLEGAGITFLSAAGITALVDALVKCRDSEVTLHMELSPEARRVLDVVGLWWLGVVDDGIAVETALQDALRSYAETAADRESLS